MAAAAAVTRVRMVKREAPVQETPNIFLHDGTAQTGPFTLSQVQAMLKDGVIGHDAAYWSEGMSDWQNVRELSAQPME